MTETTTSPVLPATRTEPSPGPGGPAPRPRSGPGSRRELLISVASLLVFDIGLNILVFNVARARGASELTAYLLAMVGPLLGIAVEWLRHRRLSHLSMFVLAINLLSAAVTMIGNTEPRWLLLKDSLLTGGVGLVVLGSLLPFASRPLMFYLGRRFVQDGGRWDQLWQAYPRFRRTQRAVTAGWGVAFLVEAAARVVAVQTLPFDAAYNIGAMLPIAVSAAGAVVTVGYVRRVRRAGVALRG